MRESPLPEDATIAIRSVVFATDFLESSRLALDFAVAFALRNNAQLTIVHALELPYEAQEVEMLHHRPSVTREHALARLNGFASGARRLGLITEVDLREGDPCGGVLSSIKENRADLLVLGTHGVYRGLEHMLIGSNAEKILLSAQCPTLTVGRHVMGGIDLDLRFNEILFISDLSPEAARAAFYALWLGKTFGIPVEVLQTVPEASLQGSKLQKAAEQFCGLLAENGGIPNREWCDPEYHLKRIVSGEKIIRRAETSVSSMAVLGVHSKSILERHLHASFAYELVAKAACPVLSIH